MGELMKEKNLVFVLGIAFTIYLMFTIKTLSSLVTLQSDYNNKELQGATSFIHEYLDNYSYNTSISNIELIDTEDDCVYFRATTENNLVFVIIHDIITGEYTVSEEVQ